MKRVRHVVVATGGFQQPRVPRFASRLDPAIRQLHSSRYRNADQLQDGPVLVVGAGNSGAEIARELAGRHPTWLSGRDTGRLPLHSTGTISGAIFWWLAHRVLTLDAPFGRSLRRLALGRGAPLIRIRTADLDAAGVRRVGRTVGSRDGRPVLEDGRVLTLRLPRGDAVAIYDRLAPRYDRFHRRWLRAGGAEAVAALQGCLAAELRPGARVLDAGCGTGALARWIAEHEPRASLTMLDASPGMLECAAAVPGRHVRGDIRALPFADGAFDIVTCAWALETVPDPARALAEMRRVVAPGGLLCYCFCAAPSAWAARLRSLPTRLVIERFFAGRFLHPDFAPGLVRARTRRMPFHRGLSTFVCYRRPAAPGVCAPVPRPARHPGLR